MSQQHRSFLSSAFLIFLVGCGSSTDSSSGEKVASTEADTAVEETLPRANHGMTIVEVPEEVSREILKARIKKPDESEPPTDAEIKLWSLPERQAIKLLSIQRVPRGGPVVAHPDGLSFVHAGERVARWKIGGKEPQQVYHDPNSSADGQTTALAISGAGDRLVTGDSDGTVCVWDTDSGQLLEREKLSKYSRRIHAVAMSPDSQTIAVLGGTASPVVLDAFTLQPKAELGNVGSGKSDLFFLDDELLVVMGEGTEVWNTRTESRLDRFASRPLELAAPIGPGRKFFHFLTYDGFRRWSPDGESRESQVPIDGHMPSSLLYSHDGTLLALAGSRVEILDASLNKRFQVFDCSRLGGICWTPNSNLLVASSISGLIRILGTEESGSSFGLVPIGRGEISLPGDLSIPPTRNQLKEIIDLRTLPKLTRAEPTTDDHFGLYYETPATVQDVRKFYRYILSQHGWTEVPTEQRGLLDTVVEFRKNGYGLYLQAFGSSRSSGDQPHTTVYLTLSDYFDMHSLQMDGTPSWELEEERANFLRYRVNESLLEIEIRLLRTVPKTGWVYFDDRHNSAGDPRKAVSVRNLRFLRNGCQLDVSVRPNDANPGSMDVTFTCTPGRIAPLPPQCTGLQTGLLDSTTARSRLSVSALRDQYDSAMREDGWRVLELATIDDVQRVMYVDGLRDVTMSFVAFEEGGTLVLRAPEQKITSSPGIDMADIPIEGPVVMSYSNWLRTKDYDISIDFLDEFESEMRAIAGDSAAPVD